MPEPLKPISAFALHEMAAAQSAAKARLHGIAFEPMPKGLRPAFPASPEVTAHATGQQRKSGLDMLSERAASRDDFVTQARIEDLKQGTVQQPDIPVSGEVRQQQRARRDNGLITNILQERIRRGDAQGVGKAAEYLNLKAQNIAPKDDPRFLFDA